MTQKSSIELFKFNLPFFLFADWLKHCLAPFSRSPSFCLPFYSTFASPLPPPSLHPSGSACLLCHPSLPHLLLHSPSSPRLRWGVSDATGLSADYSTVSLFRRPTPGLFRLARTHAKKENAHPYTQTPRLRSSLPRPRLHSTRSSHPEHFGFLCLSLCELNWACPTDNDVTLQVNWQQCRLTGKKKPRSRGNRGQTA